MESYFCPNKVLKYELIIERSRFLGFALAISDEDEAIQFLNSLKKEFYDATHVCYAYVADESGNRTRFSDSGEPSGTAGQPILNALKAGGFKKTLAAVVRYFGGTKLGTGGLTRAYGECAKAVLSLEPPDKLVLCNRYKIKTSYSDFSVLDFSKEQGVAVLDISYNEDIEFFLAVYNENLNIQQLIADKTNGLGKVETLEKSYVNISGGKGR